MRALLFLMLCTFVLPEALAAEVIGKVLAVKGQVKAVSTKGAQRNDIKLSSPIYENERIYTGEGAKVQIMFNDKSLYTIGENAEVVINEYVYDPKSGKGKSILEVTRGIFKFLTGEIAKDDPENVKVNTPFATIGVRGSGGIVHVESSGQTTLNMTECCLNIGARGGDKAPVQLTQVNTFSRVTPTGEVTAPAPASLDLLLRMNNATDLKDAEKSEQEPKNVTQESKKKKAERQTLKKLIKEKSPAEQQGSSSDRELSTLEGGPSTSDVNETDNSPEGVSDDGLLVTFGSEDSAVALVDDGDGLDNNVQEPVGDVNVTNTQQQKQTQNSVGGDGASSIEKFGQVQSGKWVAQDGLTNMTSRKVGTAKTVVRKDLNKLILERVETDGTVRDRLAVDLPQKGKARQFNNPKLGSGFAYRGLHDNFQYISSSFGRQAGLAQVVTGQTGVVNTANQSDGLAGQRLFFDFLPDTFSQKGQFANFNLAEGVQNPIKGSDFKGERRHSGAALIIDYKNNNRQFLGGHVNLSNGTLNHDYSFKFMVGEVQETGNNALIGSTYTFSDNSSNGGLQYSSGTMNADENLIFGSQTNTGTSLIDAYGVDINTGGSMQKAHLVNTGATDNLATNTTDSAEFLKGFSAGFIENFDGDGPVRVANTDKANVMMYREDSSGNGVTLDMSIRLGKVTDSGAVLSGVGDEVGFEFGDTADKAYISHNIYGAELKTVSEKFGHTSASDDHGALISSHFVDVPDRPEITETCQGCEFLTWGVWAADFDVDGTTDIATAKIIPYVTGRDYDNSWDTLSTNIGAGSSDVNYKGVLVGSISNGSTVANDVGHYDANVDFNNREVSFDGHFAGYHFHDDNVATGATGADKGFVNVQLDTLNNGAGLDVGHATINGLFYGANAEEMGGNFNFKDNALNKEAAGIYAGKKQ